MATKTWTGASSGDISTPGNWTGGAPGTGDTAVIPVVARYPSTGTKSLKSITLQSGASITGGTWNQGTTGGTFAIAGTVTGGTFGIPASLDSGGVVNPADLENPPVFNSTFTFNGGSLTGGAIFNSAVLFPTLTGGRNLISATMLAADAYFILSTAPTITEYMDAPGDLLPGMVWSGALDGGTGTRIECSQFHARKQSAAYYGDPDALVNGECTIPLPSVVVGGEEVDYAAGDLVCIYTGGTTAPDKSLIVTDGEVVTFTDSNDLWITPDATTYSHNGDAALDGQYDFSDLPLLATIDLSANPSLTLAPIVQGCDSLTSFTMNNSGVTLTTQMSFAGLTSLTTVSMNVGQTDPPVFTGCSSLESITLTACNLTATPNFAGLTALTYLNFMNATLGASVPDVSDCTALTYLELGDTGLSDPPVLTGLNLLTWIAIDVNCTLTSAEVDAIFIWAAANLNLLETGHIALGEDPDSNGPVTAASLTARNALTGAGWTLTYNT